MGKKLTDQEKAQRKRQRLLEKARELRPQTYRNKFVAKLFQRMIRAESAAQPSGGSPAVIHGRLVQIHRAVGDVVCVTCGRVGAWNEGIKGMHTGHFQAGRSNSVIFLEDNVACQCSNCNFYKSGAQQAFRQWIIEVRGRAVLDALEREKNRTVTFSHEDLVDMRIEFQQRLKAAEDVMAQPS